MRGGLLLVLALAGCGDDVATTVTDPGHGPPNAELLWPLRAGVQYGGAISVTAIAGSTPRGTPAIRLLSDHVGLGGSGVHPSEPGRDRYYTVIDDAVYYLGNGIEGGYRSPVLFVPATVREGMAWTVSAGDGQPELRFEIGAPTAEDTMYGWRRVWPITVVHDGIWTYPDGPFANRSTGAVATFRFAEGAGPLDLPMVFDSSVFTSARVPLDPAPPATPPPARIALHRLDTVFPLTQTVPRFVSGVEHDGALQLHLVGKTYYYSNFAAAHFETPIEGCLRFDGQALTMAADGECPNALGTVFVGNQQFNLGQWFSYPPGLPEICQAPCPLTGVSGFIVEDGSPKLVDGIGDLTTYTVSSDATTLTLDEEWGDVLHQYAAREISFKAMWPDGAGGWLASLTSKNRLGFARFDDAHQLLAADIEDHDQRWSRSVYLKPGAPPVRLRTTLDGRIDQICATIDGLRDRHLADLALEPGQFVTAAVPFGQQLLVLIQEGFSGFDPEFTPTGTDLSIPPQFGVTVPYLVDVAAGDCDATEIPAPEHSLEALELGNGDVEVCWRHDLGPAELEGWTLDGIPAAAVLVETGQGSCLALIRDKLTSLPVGPDPTRHTVVTGTIPQLGPVLLVTDWAVSADDTPAISMWPLADGTLSSGSQLRGPAGTVDGFLSDELPTPASMVTLDTAGGGQWYADAGGVWLLGRTVQRFAGEELAAVSPIAVAGGGILIGDHVLEPDGERTAIARDPSLPVLYVRADRATCGFDELAEGIRCIAPDGTTTLGAAYVDLLAPDIVPGSGYVDRSSTGYVTYVDQRGYLALARIDATTLAMTRIDLDGLVGIEQQAVDDGHFRFETQAAPDGALYGMIYVDVGFQTRRVMLRLGEQTTAVDLPELAGYDGGVGFRVGTDLFYVGAPGFDPAIRIARKGR